jgi:hypothetical protein
VLGLASSMTCVDDQVAVERSIQHGDTVYAYILIIPEVDQIMYLSCPDLEHAKRFHGLARVL